MSNWYIIYEWIPCFFFFENTKVCKLLIFLFGQKDPWIWAKVCFSLISEFGTFMWTKVFFSSTQTTRKYFQSQNTSSSFHRRSELIRAEAKFCFQSMKINYLIGLLFVLIKTLLFKIQIKHFSWRKYGSGVKSKLLRRKVKIFKKETFPKVSGVILFYPYQSFRTYWDLGSYLYLSLFRTMS